MIINKLRTRILLLRRNSGSGWSETGMTIQNSGFGQLERDWRSDKTKVFSVKLHLDLKFWSNQNKVKFIFISHLDKCCMDKCHSETYPLILILLVRSMCQKYIWSKQCWSKNTEAKKKHLVQKKFQHNNILRFWNFWICVILGAERLRVLRWCCWCCASWWWRWLWSETLV